MGKIIGVAGNATKDVIIKSDIEIDEGENRVIIKEGVETTSFRIKNDLIKFGEKLQVNVDIKKKIEKFWQRYKGGGGGLNSVRAISDHTYFNEDLNLIYVGASHSETIVTDSLEKRGVSSFWFGQRNMPVNLIIRGQDKLILKGPQIGDFDPSEKQIKNSENYFRGLDSLLANSIKDQEFLELCLNMSEKFDHFPVYVAISKSLEGEYILKEVLPRGVIPIFNYGELPSLFGLSKEEIKSMSSKDKMEYARDQIKYFRKELGVKTPIFVTLGEEGLYGSEEDIILKVKLKENYKDAVNTFIAEQEASNTGAGDATAGGIIAYSRIQNLSLDNLLMNANSTALRYMGMQGISPEGRIITKDSNEPGKFHMGHFDCKEYRV